MMICIQLDKFTVRSSSDTFYKKHFGSFLFAPGQSKGELDTSEGDKSLLYLIRKIFEGK